MGLAAPTGRLGPGGTITRRTHPGALRWTRSHGIGACGTGLLAHAVICALLFLAFWIPVSRERSRVEHLAADGVGTTGTVLSVPGGPGSGFTTYRYRVGDRLLTGAGVPREPNRDTGRLRPGDHLYVAYDAGSPAVSYPGDPRQPLASERLPSAWTLAGIVAALALIPSVLATVWLGRRRGWWEPDRPPGS